MFRHMSKNQKSVKQVERERFQDASFVLKKSRKTVTKKIFITVVSLPPIKRKASVVLRELGEFFKIFFGVLLGAYVAYRVESYQGEQADKRLERQYMGSLQNDLQGDNVKIASAIYFNDATVKEYDAILSFIKSPLVDKQDITNFYYLHNMVVPRTNAVNFASGAITQLYASGLKLITDSAVSNGISDYHDQVKWCNVQYEYFIRDLTDFENLSQLLVVGSIYDSLDDKNLAALMSAKDGRLIPGSETHFHEYYNKLKRLKYQLNEYNRLLSMASDFADRLNSQITVKYQLPQK